MLAENGKVKFLVGNQGKFDLAVQRCLRKMKEKDASIDCETVLAYLPREGDTEGTSCNLLPTVYPQGLENVPQRYAICRRNDWMLNCADAVIIYMNRNYGETARIYRKAKYKNLRIINLADGQKTH